MMCLGIPGRIIEKFQVGDLPMGRVDFGGVVREACLAYVPDAEVGDYAVIHVGFAISHLSERQATESLEMLREMILMDEEIQGARSEKGREGS